MSAATTATRAAYGVTKRDMADFRRAFERFVGQPRIEGSERDKREARYLARDFGQVRRTALLELLKFRPLHECSVLSGLPMEVLDAAALHGLAPAGRIGRTPMYTLASVHRWFRTREKGRA